MSLSLEDRFAIQDVVSFYAHLCDTRQLHRIAAEIFTEDAELDYGTGVLQGREAIHDFYTGHSNVIATSHNIGNFLIDGAEDEAICQCHAQAWHWFGTSAADLLPLPAADLLAIGGYQDRLRRTPAGWRIARRESVQYGSGIGIGDAPGPLKPILTGLLGRLPDWP